MRKRKAMMSLLLTGVILSAFVLQGCGAKEDNSGKVEIELVQYKQEATRFFDAIEEEFNSTHDNIRLKISSPNDATTILISLELAAT